VVIDESGTNTLRGELIVGRILYGTAINCLIRPYDDPDEWFMKQFFSTDELARYAEQNLLEVKGLENVK
jgi:hypothetical protein